MRTMLRLNTGGAMSLSVCVRRIQSDRTSNKKPHKKSRRCNQIGWEDLAVRETEVDVEAHFHNAMSFLKTPVVSSDLERSTLDRARADDARQFNVDGIRLTKEEDMMTDSRSRFNEGSFDVRRGEIHEGSPGGGDDDGNGSSTAGKLNRDILRLSGVSAKRHRDLMDHAENATSPADPTLVADEAQLENDGSGGTHVTDMLRERLMELKAAKLQDQRNETYLGNRLPLPESSRLTMKNRTTTTTTMTTREGSSDEGTVLAAAHQHTLADFALRDAEMLLPGLTEYDPFHMMLTPTQQSADVAGSSSGFGVDVLGGAKRTGPTVSVSPSTNQVGDGSVLLLRTLQRASLCSRRESIELIASGEVTVDGVVERNPFHRVVASNDIKIKGHPQRMRFAPPRLWMYNKPANVIVSRYDPAGRALITKHARILGIEHLLPIGSLPMKAHGVILLTNDGELHNFLDHPGAVVQRTYSYRVAPAIDPVLAFKLNTEGVRINGAVHRNMEFVVNPAAKSRFHVKLKMRGETIPAHQVLQHLGRQVKRGGRVSFGPFALGGLPTGSIREVTVPPFYMKHIGKLWRPFVERDWPYFRKLRLKRLTRLAKYRELLPKELEELDAFTYEEMNDSLRVERSELQEERQILMQPHIEGPPVTAFDHLPEDEDHHHHTNAFQINHKATRHTTPVLQDISQHK